MQIEANKIITLTYTLRENNAQGPILEKMDQHYPFKFLYGGLQLLPAFEAKLKGLKEGDSFAFALSPEEAYGQEHPDNIIEVPRQIFDESKELSLASLAPGDYVQLTDNHGQPHNGKLLSWTDEQVKIDFNHHMAGKTLYFTGVVLNIREATELEKSRQAYVEAGGVHRPE
jgi:FKBP-type peptidyl-prolyl cis-trans isomerase SlyD